MLTVRLSPEAATQVIEAVRADLRERQQALKRDAATLQMKRPREKELKAAQSSQE